MKKTILKVPKGVRYISDWEDYDIGNYEFQHIMNKSITGCGFTEYCIRNKHHMIILSPRKLLLQNKKDQHNDIFYFKNDLEKIVNYEKDLVPPDGKPKLMKEETKEEKERREKETLARVLQLKGEVKEYWESCVGPCYIPGLSPYKPCKILVTYDSFRHVREALGDDIKHFIVTVDEFQSVFTDAKFKSTTEIELLYQLRDLKKVCFVSATPMMDEFLGMLDEFKDLPYFELDWESEDPSRVKKPTINVKVVNPGKSVESEANTIIQKYLTGNFEKYRYTDDSGELKEVISKEGVFYLNSVSSLARIIKKNELTPLNTNVLCAKTSENEKKILKAFGIGKRELKKKYGLDSCLGTIPTNGEPHKMFTLCTRTVYLGADFYSTNARTFIFSDANIDCLSVDISMDLEQILGRQRLKENPWKDCADLFVKTNFTKVSYQEFKDHINEKINATKTLLEGYEKNPDPEFKKQMAKVFLNLAKAFNYMENFVAVNQHCGKEPVPEFNNLMMVSELRAYQMQQVDYKDRFSVFSTIENTGFCVTDDDGLNEYLEKFNSFNTYVEKLRYLCEGITDESKRVKILDFIPLSFRNAYLIFGPVKLKSLSYKKSRIEEEYELVKNNQSIDNTLRDLIFSEFSIGDRFSKGHIKAKLVEIYSKIGYKANAKATDLSRWFNLRRTQVLNKETGKTDNGFVLLKKD